MTTAPNSKTMFLMNNQTVSPDVELPGASFLGLACPFTRLGCPDIFLGNLPAVKPPLLPSLLALAVAAILFSQVKLPRNGCLKSCRTLHHPPNQETTLAYKFVTFGNEAAHIRSKNFSCIQLPFHATSQHAPTLERLPGCWAPNPARLVSAKQR